MRHVVFFGLAMLCAVPVVADGLPSAATEVLTLTAANAARKAKADSAYAWLQDPDLEPPAHPAPWAKPLHGGPIRVLFVVPRFALGDVAQLAARFDIEFEIVPTWDAHHLGCDEALAAAAVPGASAEETAGTLRKRLDGKWDVIVLANVDLGMFPEDLLAQITGKVAQGAGLFLAHYAHGVPTAFQAFLDERVLADDTSPVTAGIGEAMTPEWEGGIDFATLADYQEGRVVTLDYPGTPPQTHCLLPALSRPLLARPEYLDTYYSLVARALRWLAHREPPTFVDSLAYAGPTGPEEDEIPPDLPPEYVQAMRDAVVRQPYRPYTLTLAEPAPYDLRVQVQAREPGRGLRLIYPDDAIIPAGAANHTIWLPLGAGRYLIDIWLLRKSAVVDWSTHVVSVDEWPQFSGLTLSKGSLLPNDTLDVSVTARPLFHEPRSCLLYAKATDPLGRVVSEAYHTVPPAAGLTRLTLNFADLIAGIIRVDVFLVDRPAPPFNQTDIPRAAHASAYLPVRRMAQAGCFRLMVTAPDIFEYNAFDELNTLAGLGASIAYTSSSPTARFVLGEANLLPLPELTRYACEAATDGVLRSPCLSDPAFRDEQAAALRDRARLFTTGGSGIYAFGNGNQLVAGEENVCQSPHCLAAFQQFLEKDYRNLRELNRAWGTAFASWSDVRPSSREQAAASGRFAPWVDFRRHMDAVFADAHTHARAIVKGVDPVACAGFRAAGADLGYQGFDWYRLASQLDFLAADFDPLVIEKLRSFRSRGSLTALCADGALFADSSVTPRWLPWRLLLHQTPALWWTAPPGTAADPTLAGPLTPAGRATPIFADLAGEVEAIQRKGIDALLLRADPEPPPIAILVSRPSFFLNLADPAFEEDSHEAELRFAQLLEDLGYQYDFIAPAQAAQGKLKHYDVLILPAARALEDATLAAIEAFQHSGGRVIADVVPGRFDEHGLPRTTVPLAEICGALYDPTRPEPFAAALRDMGVEPLVQVDGGGKVPMERFAFRFGRARILALLRDPAPKAKSAKQTLHFENGQTVYDLIAGKPLRKTARVKTAIAPGAPALFAALPYAVSDLWVDAPAQIPAGRRLPITVVVKTQDELPGDHLIHIELAPEAGVPIKHYTQNLLCREGSGKTFIPLALNETPGDYTLTLTDILTATTARIPVTIQISGTPY